MKEEEKRPSVYVLTNESRYGLLFVGCEMFGFPHVESDVAEQKDVRYVGSQVLLLPLTSVRNHRTARQN